MRQWLVVAVLIASCRASVAPAQDHNAEVEELLKDFTWPGAVRLPIGVTGKGTLIWCVMDADALDYRANGARTLGVVGSDVSLATLPVALQRIRDNARKLAGRDTPGAIAVIPLTDPDRVFGGEPVRMMPFPPQGDAYHAEGQIEAHVIWRFILWFAPDVLTEVISDDDPTLRTAIETGRVQWPSDSLAEAFRVPSDPRIPKIKSHRIPTQMLGKGDARDIDSRVIGYSRIDHGVSSNPGQRSAMRHAMVERLDRVPTTVATDLSKHYGDHLKTVMYQPALALVGRMRLGNLTNDPSHQEAVGRVLEAYLVGSSAAADKALNGSQIAGHLVFADWALRTGDERAVVLVKRAADNAFNADGSPREAMPSHNEMSDAVFMGCPILTAAGRLTGDPKYLDMAATHLAFMRKLCLRDDGIYRHSPLCETAWGRGNGFPALGLALCLTDLDAIGQDDKATAALKDAAARVREQMLPAYRAHMAALLPHQDLTGTWRQVIDHPGAYRELTATCMITFAMARGLRQGWLDAETYRPVVDRAWEAIKVRVGSDGTLFDVCTGTGKQKTLQDYLDRTAILGKDERGGAMALLAAVEIAALQSEPRP